MKDGNAKTIAKALDLVCDESPSLREEAQPVPTRKAKPAIVPGSTPTWRKIIEEAQRFVTESGGSLSLSAALDQAWRADPSAWARHQAQRRTAALTA